MRSVRAIRGLGVGSVVLLAILGTTGVGIAQASGRPRITTFNINPNQTAGRQIPFSYAVRNVPQGAKIVFQRRGGGWHTMKTLRNHSGKTTAPALGISMYAVRLAVLKNGHALTDKQKTIFVYGTIPLSNLCNAANARWGNNDGGCNPSTAQVGAFLFESEATFDAPGSSNPSAPVANLTVTHGTSCRTMHLDYGESNADQQHAGGDMMITQSVIQAQTQPNTLTFPGGAIQHTDIKLDGGPFQITDQSTYTGAGSLQVLENGSLVCYTSDGVIPG